MRFPKFSGEWERFRNCTLFRVISEKNKNYEFSTVLSASQTEGMVLRDSLGIDIKFEEDSIKTYKIVRNGDYVAHLRSFQGGFAFSDKTGVCSPAYTILRPSETISYGFLKPYFMSRKFIDSLRIVTYGIRDGKSISVEEWLKLYTCIPKKNEQQKISKFLRLIDNRIETQKKIIEDLKKLKDAISKLLFRHRVGNEYSIGELCKSIAVKQYISIDVAIDGTYPIIQQGESPVAGYTESAPFFDYEKVVLFGDHTLSIYRPNVPFLLSTDGIKILRPNDLVLRDYLYYLLYAFMPKSEGYKRHYSILKDICVPVPDIDTQKSIVEELLSVDSKIEIEARFLELQIQQKEYLLNQMFI